MSVDTLTDWILFFRGSAYMAPELRVVRLGGITSTGREVITSPVVSIVGLVAVTESGSHYDLMEPAKIWADWAEDDDDISFERLAYSAMPGDRLAGFGRTS